MRPDLEPRADGAGAPAGRSSRPSREAQSGSLAAWHRVAALLAASLGLLWITALSLDGRLGPMSPAAALGLWLFVMTAAEMSPFPLRRGEAPSTLTPLADLAAALAFGPLPAAGMGLVSRAMAGAAGRQSTRKVAENAARAALILAATGIAGRNPGGFGGGWGPLPPVGLLPAAEAVLVYAALRGGLGWLAARWNGEAEPRESWVHQLGLALAFDLLLATVGAILAFTWERAGMGGAALILVALLVSRRAWGLWRESRATQLATVRTLMSALDAADPYTRGQAYRVSRMALRIARHLGIPRSAWEDLEYAALLQDIGRTAIHHNVLLKTSALDEGEKALVRTHPQVGYDLMRRLGLTQRVADIVLAHHEQPDGRGYPRGLAGTEIPLEAAILMVVTAFDGMTADRPYRRGLSPQAACEELKRCSGTQFFPDVVAALVELHESGRLYEDFSAGEIQMYVDHQVSAARFDTFLGEMRREFGEEDAGAIDVPPELAAGMEGRWEAGRVDRPAASGRAGHSGAGRHDDGSDDAAGGDLKKSA